MKACNKCGETKPTTEYYAARGNKDGLNNQCKVCLLAYFAKRYAANPEPAKRRARAWRLADPDRYKERKKKQYRANKKAHQAGCKRWAEANKERRAATDKIWRENNKERKSAMDKKYQRENADRLRIQSRASHLKRKFGITIERYDELLAAQGGVCRICSTDQPGGPDKAASFAVDHDHNSGAVRGILCFACNTAIGLFKESPEILNNAADYLESVPLFTKGRLAYLLTTAKKEDVE